MPPRFHIESLLAARHFLAPQLSGERIYFVSDLSGRMSLYAMNVGGSVPEPLVPPDVALPNPHHLHGSVLYRVLPSLNTILLMLDQDGDENYQPMFVPLDGGIPEPVFGAEFDGQQVICSHCDPETNMALFTVDPRRSPVHRTLLADLVTGATTELGESLYGNFPLAHSADFQQVILSDEYLFGDVVAYRWRRTHGARELLLGVPIEQRTPGQQVAPTGLGSAHLVDDDALLFISALHSDQYGLTFLRLDQPEQVRLVPILGTIHKGAGELADLQHRHADRFTLVYNIDGVSWVYAGVFDRANLTFRVDRILAGEGMLATGVVESLAYDSATDRTALSFSTATAPSQLYIVEQDGAVARQTNERILGIAASSLAPGEEYEYTSHDGLRISARLYLPAVELGFTGPRPVVFYIHGGPQSQEQPDFTWFSMPLIQFLTLNGIAVWVPNVRGSSGYGISYMKRIDRDWGGQDRLDHVAAYELLRGDERLDMTRVGVMGRSYGGYMTLTLAGRHPELWCAAVDMFGPYNLVSFIDRLPETWKTYFYMAVGHPERDRELLAERSPSTYLGRLACPLLVIQGANDPRVVERESRDVVETLVAEGKEVEYVVYADEGHDVIKFVNKVDCYERITGFFVGLLRP
jgi:dipeptidyl aminopeptidase/acylaminoacyl peptidase